MKIKTQLAPIFTQPLLARMALGILAGMGVASSLLPQPVLADPGYDQPLQEFQKDQRSQDLLPSTNNGDFNVFNLIHQAQLGQLRDLNEFSSEQRQNLDNAAAKFRLQQLERLRNQNQAIPVNPATTSPSVNK